jgi:hypothetical protein
MTDTEHKTINVKALIVALEDARKALDAVTAHHTKAMEHLRHLTEVVEAFLEIASDPNDSVELGLVREQARQARYYLQDRDQTEAELEASRGFSATPRRSSLRKRSST